MSNQGFTFRLEGGGFTIRDHKREVLANLGTKAQVKAFLKMKLGLKPEDDLDLSKHEENELQGAPAIKPQDGPFKKGKKWFFRVVGKVYPENDKDAFDSEEEARESYHNFE